MSQVHLLKKEFERLARIIAVSEKHKPTFGSINNDFKPYIFQDYKNNLHYIFKERGEIVYEKSTSDFDEILFWIFEDITSTLSYDFELKNRIEDQDFRRIAFNHQVKLRTKLNKVWGERTIKKHNKIIEAIPLMIQHRKELNTVDILEIFNYQKMKLI
ncbi:Imm63 family immunity protein [Christiangramia echinicola]|uniref:Immunity protein 63 n=1 Tax=Christiangramia echinicola TaxID=279359 RepID=A0A1H1KXA4_9FLAO|nr:Imm63 family immunity protein [Christiangramia echinicola]SDR66319.1 Immunity protein 63 [Christiangramia echinicola]